MIKCKICHKKYTIITNSHLLKHRITPSKYKSLYGKDSLTPDSIRKKVSNMYKGSGNPNYGNHPIPWNKGKVGVQESNIKGKTWDNFYGIGKAKEMKEKLSLIRTGMKVNFTEETLEMYRNQCKKMNQMDRSKIGILISKSLIGRMSMELNPNWQGGISFELYGKEFDNVLKEQIRTRDNHTCQLCNSPENDRVLDVHHIDYDKKNSDKSNLISLCKSCHTKTNFNRKCFESYLKSIMRKEMWFQWMK